MKKILETDSRTYFSIGFLRQLDKAEPYMRELMISLLEEVQSKIIVKQTDFDGLKNSVGELAEAQKKTEFRMEELAEAQKETINELKELAEAQKKTEFRMEELAEAQKETRNELKELAEAQKKTEFRMEELAEAQKETRNELKELAEAQKKTEEEVKNLVISVRNLDKRVGGIAMDVGYGLEDKIIPYIYSFGNREFGIEVTGVARKNIIYPDGNYDEVNIYAEGIRDGNPVFIIGECKAQPGKKDIDKFDKMTERLKKMLRGEFCLFIAGYSFTPDVEAYIRKKYPHIRFYQSYEFELNYTKGKIQT